MKGKKPRNQSKRKNVVYNETDIGLLDNKDIEIYDLNNGKDVMNNNNNILEIKTQQCKPFKELFDQLNSALNDTNIFFTKNEIKILTFNQPEQSIFICVTMPKSSFEYYYCEKENFSIGINVSKFYKFIKDIGIHETLTLFIDKNDINKLCISIENEKMKKVEISKTSLRDLNVEELQDIDPSVYPCHIKMPFSLFHNICRKSTGITDTIEIIRPEKIIENEPRKINFNFQNELIQDEREIIISEDPNCLTFIKNENESETLQGFYSIKDLILFTKKTNNSSSINLYLSNSNDLMLEYDIGDLGKIKLNIESKVAR